MTEQWAGLIPGPLVMGILNVTDDSFSGDGLLGDPARAVAAALAMVRDGASVVDIGGESTRPGAEPLSVDVEIARVVPVIEALRRTGVALSIDTRNAPTMIAALAAGAAIVNDVSALTYDPRSAGVVASAGCPVILMHMRGTPVTMKDFARYGDLVPDIVEELKARVAAAMAAGISRSCIAVDPGFGFAKDAGQNLVLLRGLHALTALGLPIVAGLSRKRFIGALTGGAAAARDSGSIAAGLFAVGQGARIIRVHDVAGTVQALTVWKALTA